MRIRRAIPEDEDVIFFLLMGMAAENTKHPVNVQKTIGKIQEVLSNGYAAMAEIDGQVVGSLAVLQQEPWWSNARFLGDAWFYVRPEHRVSRAAVMLKKAAFDFADSVGMELVLAVFSIEDAERKSQFLAKGMTFLGGTYVKEIR